MKYGGPHLAYYLFGSGSLAVSFGDLVRSMTKWAPHLMVHANGPHTGTLNYTGSLDLRPLEWNGTEWMDGLIVHPPFK